MSTLLAEDYRVAAEPSVREADGAGEALPVYLQEIGRVPLLTGPAEVELATAIETGTAAAEQLTQRELLSPAEVTQAEAELAQGREARRRLIEANLRLVV